MMLPLRLLATFLVASSLSAPLFAQNEQTLYNFSGTDGNSPLSGLVMDAAGNLYGATFVGGAYGDGVIFEVSRDASGGWTETVIYNFTGGTDGGTPANGNMIFDAAGNLYGTTVNGGTHNLGTVFELTPSAAGWSESVLYSFRGIKDGANPYMGLVFDGKGNLYGTTYYGGTYDAGTVFELSRAGSGQWTEKVIHTFNVTNGIYVPGGLAIDGAGNLYGVAQNGGTYGVGVVYELSPGASGSWTGTILHEFTGANDGGYPYAERLLLDSSGNLYGTTQGGGAFNYGTVFRLSHAGKIWEEQVLHSFDNYSARNPNAGLITDEAGNLYGTCANGNGISSVGAVFELSPESGGTWKPTILHVFKRTDGEFPVAPLVRDTAGNLYGTTWLGGANNIGVVFEIKP